MTPNEVAALERAAKAMTRTELEAIAVSVMRRGIESGTQTSESFVFRVDAQSGCVLPPKELHAE